MTQPVGHFPSRSRDSPASPLRGVSFFSRIPRSVGAPRSLKPHADLGGVSAVRASVMSERHVLSLHGGVHNVRLFAC